MDVLIDVQFATALLGYGHAEVPAEVLERFEMWIHALVQSSDSRNDFNDL